VSSSIAAGFGGFIFLCARILLNPPWLQEKLFKISLIMGPAG
jgi:hypothetical protein